MFKHNFKTKHSSSYSKNSSSTNLHRHLQKIHSITIKKVCPEKKKIVDAVLENKPTCCSLQKQLSEKEKKYVMGRELALWISRDLHAFEIVSGAGFRAFMFNIGAIKSDNDLLNPRTIAKDCLDDIYNGCYQKLMKILEENLKDFCAITVDAWTDRHAVISYMTFTVHFITEETVLMNFTLKTCAVDSPHTAQNLADEIRKVLREFNLRDKNVTFVTDGGRNIVKAIELLGYKRQGCLAHSLHRLITHDIFEDKCMNSMSKILSKLKHIYRALVYKKADLETEQKSLVNKEIWQKFSQELSKIRK